MMNTNTMNAMATIVRNGRDFFASDYEMNGGTISALARVGLIEKTGKTRESFVEVDSYEHLYRKCEVNEWRVSNRGIAETAKWARSEANKMVAFAEALESLC